jgi:hypothetical protein
MGRFVQGFLLHRRSQADRPYVHDSFMGAEQSVCQVDQKGRKSFFMVHEPGRLRSLGTRLLGNTVVIGARVPGWWHLADVSLGSFVRSIESWVFKVQLQGCMLFEIGVVTGFLHPCTTVGLARQSRTRLKCLHEMSPYANNTCTPYGVTCGAVQWAMLHALMICG